MRYLFTAATAALLAIAGPMPAHAQGQVSGTAFNPAISLILNGTYASYSRDPAEFAISGFALSPEAGFTPEGLSVDESELALSANVDDKFYGFSSIALAQDAGQTSVELEEAWFETLTLPEGLTVKAGRFLSEIGYLNPIHAHAWDFADAPLAYTAMLNGSYSDSGIQLRWLAPTILYLQVGGELMRGDSYPASGAADSSGTGAYSVFAHIGGDIGSSHSWRAGLSFLSADANSRAISGTLLPAPGYAGDATSALDPAAGSTFTGKSDLMIGDFVWKWARNGNPRDRNFVVQGEFLHRREHGTLALTGPATGILPDGHFRATQDGWYLQGVYLFRPRWRVGARYDRLHAGNDVQWALLPGALATGHDPSRETVMVDFSNSEFSRLRLQLSRDRSRPETDRQLYLQYIMSMGAHGAHRF